MKRQHMKKYKRHDLVVEVEEFFPYKDYPGYPVKHIQIPNLVDKTTYEEVKVYKQGQLMGPTGEPTTDPFNPGTLMLKHPDGSFSAIDPKNFYSIFNLLEG
jgi:hypothetical protein